jgi:hypothetical protein
MGMPCGRTGCICTHTEECDHGWIWVTYWVDARGHRCSEFDNIKKRKYEGVVPCRNCDPERWQLWNTSTSSKEYGEKLRARSQSNRTKAYEDEERSRTRTL